MTRVELTKQLLRMRSLIALAALAAVPVLSALATAGQAGGRNGAQDGLYGAAPFSALNHAAASLQFTSSLLLPLVVALLGSALGAADRDWGTLRYLLVLPVGRRRLLAGKWSALVVCCLVATACVLMTGAVVGAVVFGWHPFHRLGAGSLTPAAAAARLLGAGAYVSACMLGIGSIALALGLILPGQAEALAASVAVVVVANLLDRPSLHALDAVLPTHYWQRWTQLLDGAGGHLATGILVQAATIAVALAAAATALARRDPAG